MSQPSLRVPDSVGHLAQQPIPRLLFYLYRKVFSGELVTSTKSDDKSLRIYFNKGCLVAADQIAKEDNLAQILVERNLISAEAYLHLLRVSIQGDTAVAQLVYKQQWVSREQLLEALNCQLRRKLNRFFYLEAAPFQLYSGVPNQGIQGVFADPLWIIYHGIRNTFNATRLQSELNNLYASDKAISLRPEYERHLTRYGFGPEEQLLMQVLLRTSVAPADLHRVSHLSELETQMVVYTLLITDALHLQTVPRAVTAQTSDAMRRPRPPSALLVATNTSPQFAVGKSSPRASMEDLLEDAVAAIGVGPKDGSIPIALRSSVPWRDGNQRLSGSYSYIGNRSSAPATLSQEDVESQLPPAQRAAAEFERGMNWMKKKGYKQAQQHFAKALALNPNEADHHAWYAWSIFNDREVNLSFICSKLRDHLKKAVELAPKNVNAHYFLGELYLTQEDTRSAIHCFLNVLELDQNHLESRRQLRLIKSRRASQGVNKK